MVTSGQIDKWFFTLGQPIGFVFPIVELDLTINRLDVHFLNLLSPDLVQLPVDGSIIILLALGFEFLVDLLVLREYVLMQELGTDGKTCNILGGHVNPLALELIDGIMVTDYLSTSNLFAKSELVSHTIRDKTKSNLDGAF